MSYRRVRVATDNPRGQDEVERGVLRAVNLEKVYRSGNGRSRSRSTVRALTDVNVNVAASETLGVVGESGSGKSTLARLLMALDEPTGGEVYFKGQRVSRQKERDRITFRSSVQMVFQDPGGSLDPRMKVGEIVEEPLLGLKVAGDRARRVRQVLDSVGISPTLVDRYPHEFSGGQRQRIAIARALAPGPEVLVADEAVSALDVSVRAQVLNVFADMATELKLAMVFISHDMSVVRHLCDRIIVLYQGRIVEAGNVMEVYEHAGHPYTKRLLQSVPQVGKAWPGGATDSNRLAPAVGGCPYVGQCDLAQETCRTEVPVLRAREVGGGHRVACHLA